MDLAFSDWLQGEMNERGFTNAELARRAGLSRQAIGDYTNRRRTPEADTCKAIAHALGLPEAVVLRAAGHLESVSEEDEFTEELLHILDNATPEQRQQVRDFARFILGLTK